MVDVGVDLHKSYSQVAVLDAWGEIRQEQIEHQGSAMEEFVRSLSPGADWRSRQLGIGGGLLTW